MGNAALATDSLPKAKSRDFSDGTAIVFFIKYLLSAYSAKFQGRDILVTTKDLDRASFLRSKLTGDFGCITEFLDAAPTELQPPFHQRDTVLFFKKSGDAALQYPGMPGFSDYLNDIFRTVQPELQDVIVKDLDEVTEFDGKVVILDVGFEPPFEWTAGVAQTRAIEGIATATAQRPPLQYGPDDYEQGIPEEDVSHPDCTISENIDGSDNSSGRLEMMWYGSLRDRQILECVTACGNRKER